MIPAKAVMDELNTERARMELEAQQPVTTKDYLRKADIAPFEGVLPPSSL